MQDCCLNNNEGRGQVILNLNFNDTESEIGVINESLALQGNQQKFLELEVKVRNYQRENKELYDKIREDNEEYLCVLSRMYCV